MDEAGDGRPPRVLGAGSPLSEVVVHDAHLASIDPVVLYGILALRAEAFVVEQACVYLDPDGLDLEPGCRQLWIADDGGAVVATCRVRTGPDGATWIGRVVTAPAARGQGLAGRLVEHALAVTDGPWALAAQAHLAGWYGDFGFEVSGEEYVEDGIPHVPMRRPSP